MLLQTYICIYLYIYQDFFTLGRHVVCAVSNLRLEQEFTPVFDNAVGVALSERVTLGEVRPTAHCDFALERGSLRISGWTLSRARY